MDHLTCTLRSSKADNNEINIARGLIRRLGFGLPLLLAASMFNTAALAQSYEQVAVGESHICALDSSGIVDCTATTIAKRLIQPDNLPAMKDITAGQQHSCGITLQDEVQCWGQNAFGVLDAPQFNSPVKTLSAGRNHTCAIEENGQTTCWGLNTNGQLNVPAATFTTLSANLSSSCGILTNGDIVCWTSDEKFFTAQPVPGPFINLDLARNVGCGLTANGDIECFATTFGDSPTPPTNGPYSDLTVTDSSICGLKTDGWLDCSFSQFRDEDELLSAEFPTDLQFTSIERSAERFTPTPICGVVAGSGAISCFGGNKLPAPPGSMPSIIDSLIISDINLGLSALIYSTTAVELFWNRVPQVFPSILIEIFRDDELLTTTDASFSFFDTESTQNTESRYRIRAVSASGNRGDFSNEVLVNRATGQIQVSPSEAPTAPSNPRPNSSITIENLVINSPSGRSPSEQSTVILSWDTNNPSGESLAGYQIDINNEEVAFVSATTSVYLDRDFLQDCRIYTVSAISAQGEILDFRSGVLNPVSRGQRCPSSN